MKYAPFQKSNDMMRDVIGHKESKFHDATSVKSSTVDIQTPAVSSSSSRPIGYMKYAPFQKSLDQMKSQASASGRSSVQSSTVNSPTVSPYVSHVTVARQLTSKEKYAPWQKSGESMRSVMGPAAQIVRGSSWRNCVCVENTVQSIALTRPLHAMAWPMIWYFTCHLVTPFQLNYNINSSAALMHFNHLKTYLYLRKDIYIYARICTMYQKTKRENVWSSSETVSSKLVVVCRNDMTMSDMFDHPIPWYRACRLRVARSAFIDIRCQQSISTLTCIAITLIDCYKAVTHSCETGITCSFVAINLRRPQPKGDGVISQTNESM